MKNHPDFVQLWCAKQSSHYWAEVHISHRVIVFVLYGKKIKYIRILGYEWIPPLFRSGHFTPLHYLSLI